MSGNTPRRIDLEIRREALVTKYVKNHCIGNTSGSIGHEIRQEVLVKKYIRKHWSGNTSGSPDNRSITRIIPQEMHLNRSIRKIDQKIEKSKYWPRNTSGSIGQEIFREALVMKYVRKHWSGNTLRNTCREL